MLKNHFPLLRMQIHSLKKKKQSEISEITKRANSACCFSACGSGTYKNSKTLESMRKLLFPLIYAHQLRFTCTVHMCI